MRYMIAMILFLPFLVSSQVEVSAGFDKDTILIGDQVGFTFGLKVPPGTQIQSIDITPLDSIFSAFQTSLAAKEDTTKTPDPVVGDYTIDHFGSWNDKNGDKTLSPDEFSWTTTPLGNNQLLENKLMISFWDPGPMVMRLPAVTYTLDGQSYTTSLTQYVSVYVKPPFTDEELANDSLDIAPIKPIIKEKKTVADYLIFLWVALGLLAAFLLWKFLPKLTQKKVEEIPEIVIKRPAHVIALEQLHQLKQEQLWKIGEIKAYQSKLTHVIREYLENRYGIKALESTTDEIITDLRKVQFDKKDEEVLKNILQVADLVKFAKAKPTDEVHEQFLHYATEFVDKTKIEEITE